MRHMMDCLPRPKLAEIAPFEIFELSTTSHLPSHENKAIASPTTWHLLKMADHAMEVHSTSAAATNGGSGVLNADIWFLVFEKVCK
jgi:hypothetical protein